MEVIRSAQNPAIKRARAVGEGKEKGFLLLEGARLVREALQRRLLVEFCLVSEESQDLAGELAASGALVRLAQKDVLARASQLVTPPGVLAVSAAPPAMAIGGLNPRKAPLIVVAYEIADPGNLGALARTAEAAGVWAFVAVGGANPWGAKALRGSMGSLLRIPVSPQRAGSASAVIAALDSVGYRQVRAATRDGADYAGFEWRPSTALWITSETGELPPDAWGFPGVTIPMAGSVESLNVSTAAAVLLFAARAAIARR
ncbi:MAG: RNA methyltransferase [Planctomycetota bacterium]